MVYMFCGTYITLRDGCSTEIQSTVEVGDYFGIVKNGCICNPWVAFAGTYYSCKKFAGVRSSYGAS